MVKLVEKQYGQKKITPNMHLCLHIYECALDYGPLYSFWCYSFEQINGLLGNININIISQYFYKISNIYQFTGVLHSSNRHIKLEWLNTVQPYSILDELSTSGDE